MSSCSAAYDILLVCRLSCHSCEPELPRHVTAEKAIIFCFFSSHMLLLLVPGGLWARPSSQASVVSLATPACRCHMREMPFCKTQASLLFVSYSGLYVAGCHQQVIARVLSLSVTCSFASVSLLKYESCSQSRVDPTSRMHYLGYSSNPQFCPRGFR